ncbi:MAG: hypothetical protein ACUVQZ_00035 [Candidatus Caldatribacteriaceae bacterium]
MFVAGNISLAEEGYAELSFPPHLPPDLNEVLNLIGQESLPTQTIVVGYRVLIHPHPPSALWKQYPGYSGYWYHQDYKASYLMCRECGHCTYRQQNPQILGLRGLEAGTTYEYKIFPLVIIAKFPWNMDENGKPFYYYHIGPCGNLVGFGWVTRTRVIGV